MRTTAVSDDTHSIINGSKCFICKMGPTEGNFVTILAIIDPALGTKGMSAIAVERGPLALRLASARRRGASAPPMSVN